MKKFLLPLVAFLFIASSAIAQETEMKVKVVKDGKVLKDTTLVFDDAKKAKHAMKLMEVIADEDIHEAHASNGEGKVHKKMVFISEDGEMEEVSGEKEMKWIISEDGEHMDIHKETIIMDGTEEVEKIIINDGDGDVEVIIKKMGEDGDKIKKIEKKKVIIIDDSKDSSTTEWTIKEGEEGMVVVSSSGESIKLVKKSGEVTKEDGKVEKWVSDDSEENINVVVIKKEKGDKKEMEMDVVVKGEKGKGKRKK